MRGSVEILNLVLNNVYFSATVMCFGNQPLLVRKL